MLVGHDAAGQPITRSIEEVRVGDYVLAKAEGDAGDDVELRRVTEVFRYTKDHLRVLSFVTADGREQVIKTTDEHPFYVEGRGWIGASGLLVGDRILQLDGGYATLASTLREEHAAGVTVYNFTVEGDHTYFVDDEVAGGAVWVHNTCAGKHHFVPRSLGGVLSYGHSVLTRLNVFRHTKLHTRLALHLDGITKVVNGHSYTMLPKAGQSGDVVRRVFSPQERIAALDQYYRNYNKGEYYRSFLEELSYILSKGKFQ